jgi:hypothetical protein
LSARPTGSSSFRLQTGIVSIDEPATPFAISRSFMQEPSATTNSAWRWVARSKGPNARAIVAGRIPRDTSISG